MRKAVFLAVLLAACGGDAPEGEAPATETPAADVAEAGDRAAGAAMVGDVEVAFAPELGVDLSAMEKQPSGLYVLVLEEGEGPVAVPGDTMGIHYTVWLPDGNKVDSSFDHPGGNPYPTVLGVTPLIDGWVEGVTGMRLGEKRLLVLPYDLAYGEAGSPPAIPPRSVLVFNVELAEHAPGPK